MRKTTMRTIATATVLMGLVFAGEAGAQGFGVGVGIYRGSGYSYPYFGGYPLQYRGFYGNGMSLYGPPVPTYGIVPGTFGGSDYRVNQNAPFLGFPVGIYANYSRSRSRPIANEGVGEPPLLDERSARAAVAVINENAVTVEIRVPLDNVIVFVDDQFLKQNGIVRYISSPPLKPDQTRQFSIRAVWTIDGQRNDKTLLCEGQPGDRLVADFLKRGDRRS